MDKEKKYKARRELVLASLPKNESQTSELAKWFYPAHFTRTPESLIGPRGEDLRPWYLVRTSSEEKFFQALAVLPPVARGEAILEDHRGRTKMRTELGRWFSYDGEFMPYLRIEVSKFGDIWDPMLASPKVIPTEVVCKKKLIALLEPVTPVLPHYPFANR